MGEPGVLSELEKTVGGIMIVKIADNILSLLGLLLTRTSTPFLPVSPSLLFTKMFLVCRKHFVALYLTAKDYQKYLLKASLIPRIYLFLSNSVFIQPYKL